ncbi:MAG: DUF1559 domain-containing protein [Planctomycetota bacterium]
MRSQPSIPSVRSEQQMSSNRRGFTLVELLVVIAIIGVLVGLSLPAMQNMRELSRRSNCQQNLIRLSLAISAYSFEHGHYPAGTINETGPIVNVTEGYHHNWIAALLPSLDEEAVAAAIDTDVGVYHVNNQAVRELQLGFLMCPSNSMPQPNTSSYAGIHASTETPIDEGNDGVFRLNLQLTDDDIKDGTAHTIFLAEKLSLMREDFGWISGTRSTLRNTGLGINGERERIRGPQDANSVVKDVYVGGIASDHPGGAHILLGSGDCQFRSDSMDLKLLQQLANIADGEIPADFKTTEE